MNESNQELMNVAANLMRGVESVGGKLKLTPHEIVFTPNKVNVQSAPLTIPMNEIKHIEKRNTVFVVPNGLRLDMKNGEEHKFVVNNRRKLIDLITEHMNR